jgi:hypothetical protein
VADGYITFSDVNPDSITRSGAFRLVDEGTRAVFDRAERPAIAHAPATADPSDATDGPEPPPPDGSRRRRRSPRLAAALLAVVCTAACQSTTVSVLNVRARPTTGSAVVGKLSGTGTALTIECYTRGQAIHGQTTWYRITGPRVGYVTAYYVHTDSTARDNMRAC